jgi:hypothetical protein
MRRVRVKRLAASLRRVFEYSRRGNDAYTVTDRCEKDIISSPERRMNELQKNEAVMLGSHENSMLERESPILGNSDLKRNVLFKILKR